MPEALVVAGSLGKFPGAGGSGDEPGVWRCAATDAAGPGRASFARVAPSMMRIAVTAVSRPV